LDFLFYRRSNKIFTLSDFEANHVLGLGIDPSLIERVGCAASIPFQGQGAELIAKHNIGDRFRILFIGRKSSTKGYFNLRRAIANLICRFPQVVLISIGNRVESEEVPLPSSVDIDLGCADEDVKQNALAACDLLCVPSSHESFGIVYTEAWGYGKPVICGAAPASQELVENHRGGIATDGSVHAIELSIIRLIKNPQEAREMGRCGKVAQGTHFNPDSVVEKHIDSWQLGGPDF
jgi:glycosyltransferase involved in cell wall biosynthesis